MDGMSLDQPPMPFASAVVQHFDTPTWDFQSSPRKHVDAASYSHTFMDKRGNLPCSSFRKEVQSIDVFFEFDIYSTC